MCAMNKKDRLTRVHGIRSADLRDQLLLEITHCRHNRPQQPSSLWYHFMAASTSTMVPPTPGAEPTAIPLLRCVAIAIQSRWQSDVSTP